ncbi:disease resistance protein RGA5-like [Lolium rigidum]|uniref:disease resistance protein RGA5-like n=1 Tax=Lolium rigidum TaxID=89674 RepID=UPI001F5D35ED|nr:disease resistance protein RGA5-like [Lolium rigidum]
MLRYFIVVDDVWDVQTWNIIKCAFSKSSCSSRIITTTRVSEVAKACSISYGGDVYNLRPLSIVDSKWLFLQRIFGSAKECPPHLKRVSDKILKKCGGLPLAIISISGLLATNSEEDQWEQVQESIGHGLGSNPGVEGMMRILSFSYFGLSPCLKSCLLYLSVFPEDADIWKGDLVRRWIWEGIIPEENGQTLYELGERCFNELINRSLIHPTRRSSDGKSISSRVASFRVHDMILDFVIAKSREQNFVTLLGVPGVNPDPHMKARRLSLQNGCKIPTGLDLSKARSLVCFGVSFNMPSLLDLKNLRVLEFYECPELEDHHVADIGNLCHLKHLRFGSTGITKFPEQIVELKFLETLEIVTERGEKGFVIPSTLCQLQRLTHLVVSEGTILPDEIGSMQALQVLGGINVISHSIIFCQQLGQLTNLRTLGIEFQDNDVCDNNNIEENIKETMSSICKLAKTNLYDLCVSGGYCSDSLFDEFNIEDFLDESCLFALRGLRTLDFDCHVAPPRIPTSMSLLANLQELSIMMLVINQEDIEILGGVPALRRLFLDVEKAGPEGGQIRISSLCGFRSLTNFGIGSYNCILRFIFESGSMPKLQTLRFNFSETDQLDFGIQHLSSLTYMQCACTGANGANTKQKLKDAIEREIEVHPNNPTLEW